MIEHSVENVDLLLDTTRERGFEQLGVDDAQNINYEAGRPFAEAEVGVGVAALGGADVLLHVDVNDSVPLLPLGLRDILQRVGLAGSPAAGDDAVVSRAQGGGQRFDVDVRREHVLLAHPLGTLLDLLERAKQDLGVHVAFPSQECRVRRPPLVETPSRLADLARDCHCASRHWRGVETLPGLRGRMASRLPCVGWAREATSRSRQIRKLTTTHRAVAPTERWMRRGLLQDRVALLTCPYQERHRVAGGGASTRRGK